MERKFDLSLFRKNLSVLPAMSRKLYDKCYHDFMAWKMQKRLLRFRKTCYWPIFRNCLTSSSVPHYGQEYIKHIQGNRYIKILYNNFVFEKNKQNLHNYYNQ